MSKHVKMLSEYADDCLTIGPLSPEVVLKTGKKMRKSKLTGRDDKPADLFLLALPHLLPAIKICHLHRLNLRPHGKFLKSGFCLKEENSLDTYCLDALLPAAA